jgi:antitoxin CptB
MHNDDLSNIRRRRLLFRCWHRGTLENDLLLGSFADTCLAGFDNTQLERFEALLDCPDPDVCEWVLGSTPPPAEHQNDVLSMLRAFRAAQRDPGELRSVQSPELDHNLRSP